MCMENIPKDVREFMTKPQQVRELIVERRCLTYSLTTGTVFCACVFCGNTFVTEYSARRHIKTSKKCIQNRRVIHEATAPKPPKNPKSPETI